jgi:hypothetical protein
MDRPTSFSSLPPELVTKICRHHTLWKRDFIALRLTSKSQGIYHFASEEFAKRCFTDISLVYTRYSLQTFVEICKHPIFGRAVRHVELSYTRFRLECLGQESTRLFAYLGDRTTSEERHEYLDSIRLLVNRCDEEEHLKGSDDAEDLLTAAFTALSQWHHPLELFVSSSESPALSEHEIYGPEMVGQYDYWECDVLGTVALLYLSATFSECVVQRLQIQGLVWCNLVDSSTNSWRALAQLPELELSIWPAEGWEFGRIPGLEGMVTKLLHNAVGLKSLEFELSSRDYSYQSCLDETFSSMSITRLEKLTLYSVDFIWFEPFKKRMKSLRHLELYNCVVQGGWENVLSSIEKNFPRLEYFLLYGIDRSWMSKRHVELKGVQEVNDGINKLIQSEADYFKDSSDEN